MQFVHLPIFNISLSCYNLLAATRFVRETCFYVSKSNKSRNSIQDKSFDNKHLSQIIDCVRLVENGENMELKLYLVKNRIKVQDFAKKLGCSRTHLSEVINGKKRAGSSLAKLIELTTNGEITAEEVIDLYQPKGK